MISLYDVNNNYIPVDIQQSKEFSGGNKVSTELVKIFQFESDAPAFRFFTGSLANPPSQQVKFNFSKTAALTGSINFASAAFDDNGNYIEPSSYTGNYPGGLTNITNKSALLSVANFSGSDASFSVSSIVYTASVEDFDEFETIYRLEDGLPAADLVVTNDRSIKYSGIEVSTLYTNHNNVTQYPVWDEAINIYTCKNVTFPESTDVSAIKCGQPSVSIFNTEQLNILNEDRQGALIVNPCSVREMVHNWDARRIGIQIYDSYLNHDSYRFCQQYVPSQKLEIQNGNISFTSYHNSNSSVYSYNQLIPREGTTSADASLNLATIDGLNQVIYDTDGQGNYNWKWGHGIGSFLNYGRGYYEFPEEQISTWTGNGNNEPGTDLHIYNNKLTESEKFKFRRNMLNNSMMSGLLIETHLNNHETFLPHSNNDSNSKNSFNTDVENKHPPSESLHFLTYSDKYWSSGSEIVKEWQGENVYGYTGNKIAHSDTIDNPLPDIFNKKTYGGEIRMSINQYGNVGIGTTEPVCPLEINGFTANSVDISLGFRNRYLGDTGRITSAAGEDNHPTTASSYIFYSDSVTKDVESASFIPVSAKLSTNLLCSGVVTHSDSRIKTNIIDVPDNLALEQLRNIPCRYYEYIDKLERGVNKTIGFIAQEVKSVLSMAVSQKKEIIPNIYKIINCTWTSIGDKFSMTSSDLSDVNGITHKFYVSNETDASDEIMINITGNSDNTFTFDKQYNNIFCYGSEVDDFHTLDKHTLFTLNFSATQEIDRIQQQHITEIETLKTENATLKTENATLKVIIDKLTSATSFEEFKNSL